MAIIITEECINCGACEPECPNNAIYEGGIEWALADGTTLTGKYLLDNGEEIEVIQKTYQSPTIIITSCQINVRNVQDFTKNHNALQFVPWIAAYQTLIM